MEVQLDAVYRHFLEHMQGGIAAAEIVHLHLKPEFPQLFRGGNQQGRVLNIVGFGDLNAQLVDGQTVGLDQIIEVSGDVLILPDIVARQIQRDGPMESRLVPPAQVLAGPVPDKAVQLIDQAGLLQCGNKLGGAQPSQPGVIPAAERFHAGDFSSLKIHLRLIPDLKLSGPNRRGQMADDIRDPFSLFPLGRVIEPQAVPPGVADPFLRHSRKVQHVVHVDLPVVLRRQRVYAAANLDPQFHALIGKVIPQRIDNFTLIPLHFLLVLDAAEDGKVVVSDAADGLLVGQGFLRFRSPKAQQRIP